MAPPGNQAANGENKPQPVASEETGLLDSLAEQKQLLNYLNNMKKGRGTRNVKRWLLVTVALNTGLRASELCDLQLTDLFVEAEYPYIKACTKKNGDGSIVYISSKLAQSLKWYLKHYANGSPCLFTSETGQKQTPTGLYLLFQTALKKAGVSRYPLHILRHTFATNVYRISKDIRMTQKQLHHRSIQSTMIYADVSVEDTVKVMNQL